MSNKPELKLEDRLRGVLRLKQYSPRTEETFIQWCKRFVRFQAQVARRKAHPAEMGTAQVTAFLTYLAVNKNLADSFQNQALNALIILDKELLQMDLLPGRVSAFHHGTKSSLGAIRKTPSGPKTSFCANRKTPGAAKSSFCAIRKTPSATKSSLGAIREIPNAPKS